MINFTSCILNHNARKDNLEEIKRKGSGRKNAETDSCQEVGDLFRTEREAPKQQHRVELKADQGRKL